jgi:Putative metal-binding motif
MRVRSTAFLGVLLAACSSAEQPPTFKPDPDGGVDVTAPTDRPAPSDVRPATDVLAPVDRAPVDVAPTDLGGDVNNRYDVTPSSDAPTCDAGGACTPRPDGCAAREMCNDGLDNNCDGRVDELCPCIPGTVQRCSLAPPGRRAVGTCSDGNQTCVGTGEFGTWSPCAGAISPSAEVCDGADNDCDGCADNGLCCRPPGTCPSAGDPRVPTGRPFTAYSLSGATFFPGAARAWRWRVVGGPCDQLVYATRSRVSYRLMGAGADPRVTNTENLTFTPTLSGDYTVTLTVTAADGSTFECTFVVSVRAPGLRVELCWDRTGNPRATDSTMGADIDLWLQGPRVTGTWGFPPGFEPDHTCGPYNCFNRDSDIPSIFVASRPNWGYAPSTGGACRTPDVGGTCKNPRLDLDNNGLNDATHSDVDPENINVDNPRDGDGFRVAAYYWRGSVPAQPMINIYCGGALRATFGGAMVGGTLYGSAPVTGFTSGLGGFDRASSFWRVADVTLRDGGNACDIVPLVPTGMTSGACVQTGTDRSYNGPCQRRAP